LRGQLPFDLPEPLEHELACPPEIGPVFEDDRDRREPEARHGAHLDALGNAVQRLLDGDRDGALDLDGGEPPTFRQNVDLHARDVREGVDGQAACGHDSEDEHHDEERGHHLAKADGKGDELFEHGYR
jgi:hypothetical protein